MNKTILNTLATTTFGVLALTASFYCNAQLRSKSKEIVVMEPHTLPEAAQTGGNSFFLHADSTGSTFLYVEQNQGAQLTVFDVTDPSRLKTVITVPLTVGGPFDFIRPLNGRAELIRFRDGKGVGVLDLKNVKKPSIRIISALVDSGQTESLGVTAFLGVNDPYNYVRVVPQNFQVVDLSAPANPSLLTTVKLVKHRVVNDDTGTTFLLGIEGLTVVRRISVEKDYKTHQMQMSGN